MRDENLSSNRQTSGIGYASIAALVGEPGFYVIGLESSQNVVHHL